MTDRSSFLTHFNNLNLLSIIDNTHTLSSDNPGYMNEDTVIISKRIDIDNAIEYKVTLSEHYGTHIDAPLHYYENCLSVDKILPKNLIGPAVVIDVQNNVENNEDYELTIGDLNNWEKQYGDIPSGAIVIMFSGWQNRWKNPASYRNIQNGIYHFPGFSINAIEWLLKNRVINGIGIDTLSVDKGCSTDFSVHKKILKEGKWCLENLCNLSNIPAFGSLMIVSPLKHKGGSGGPARIFTFKKKHRL